MTNQNDDLPNLDESNGRKQHHALGLNQTYDLINAMQPLLRRLPPMTAKVEDGYCEYIDKNDSDEVVAQRLSQELGFKITKHNVAYIRQKRHGKLRTGFGAGYGISRANKLTQLEERVAELEKQAGHDTADWLNSVRSLRAALEKRLDALESSTGDMPAGRLAEFEAKVNDLASHENERQKIYTNINGHLNRLEERMKAVEKATTPSPTPSSLSSLRDKYRKE